MLERYFNSRSIRHKVVFQVTFQVVLALVMIILLTVFFVNNQLNQQIEARLELQAGALNEKIEQRLQYLVENTQLLASNDLMINALTDSKGRETYLPPLVKKRVSPLLESVTRISEFSSFKDKQYLSPNAYCPSPQDSLARLFWLIHKATTRNKNTFFTLSPFII